MKTTLTVTAKGQVTLRKQLLDHLGIVPGDKLTVDLLPSGRVEVRAAQAPGSIEDFIGCLASSDRPTLSIDDIKEIAAQGWAGDK